MAGFINVNVEVSTRRVMPLVHCIRALGFTDKMPYVRLWLARRIIGLINSVGLRYRVRGGEWRHLPLALRLVATAGESDDEPN